MKRFCFVQLDAVNRTPYIRKYISAADFRFDLILWDRGRNSDSCGAERCYRFYMDLSDSGIRMRVQKAIAYVRFARFCNRILRKNKYDGIFVFAANTACLCAGTLMKQYEKQYVLDFRDYWLEDKKWLYNLEKKLLTKCYAAVISSKAFERFLPPFHYYMSHNSQLLEQDLVNHFREMPVHKDRLVIACIGGVKKIDYDKRVIDYFANDPRFEIRYIGRGYEPLRSYCEDKKYENVYIEGEFLIEDTMKKYEGVDLILNMYGNHTPKLDYALSNKLYFSAQLGRPILVCPDTYMAEMVAKYGTGFVVDIDNPADKDFVFIRFGEMERAGFYRRCDAFLEDINEDELRFRQMVQAFTAE